MVQSKIIGAVVILLLVAGAGFWVERTSLFRGDSTSSSMGHSVAIVPTPAWYEAHLDSLKTDNERCSAEGSNLPPGLCSNVAIADKVVSDDDALNALNQASGTLGK